MGRSCRLTGAATFSGLGIYALRQAQLQGTFQKIRPKGGSIIGGQITAAIGLGEFWESVRRVLVPPGELSKVIS